MGPRLKLFAAADSVCVLALFLFRGLGLDPNEMPSALIDQPLPAFSLPGLGRDGLLSRSDVIGQAAC